MNTTSSIYQTTDQLDHDMEAELWELIKTFTARGVDFDDALNSAARVLCTSFRK